MVNFSLCEEKRESYSKGMFPHFKEIFWKNSRPQGRTLVQEPREEALSYTIIHDPYYKRISVERYKRGIFDQTVYDTALFDARSLTEREQLQWQRIAISENEEERVDALKDGNHRTLYLEKQRFEKGFPRACSFFSPHGLFLAKSSLFYELLGDSWSGVLLEDSEGRPILKKCYSANQEGAFIDLKEERRDFS